MFSAYSLLAKCVQRTKIHNKSIAYIKYRFQKLEKKDKLKDIE